MLKPCLKSSDKFHPTNGKFIVFHEIICRAVVRAGATGAIAPVDFEKGPIAPVDLEELLQKNFITPIDSTHHDKPICTLEYMNRPIKTGQKLPLKIECTLHKGGGAAQICTRELDPIAAALIICLEQETW